MSAERHAPQPVNRAQLTHGKPLIILAGHLPSAHQTGRARTNCLAAGGIQMNQLRGLRAQSEFDLPSALSQKIFAAGVLLLLALCPPTTRAQTTSSKDRGFWVSGAASVTVAPDQAIVVMTIRTTAATLEEALRQNKQKTADVQRELSLLELDGKYRITGSQFYAPARSAGPHLAIARPNPSFVPYNRPGPQFPNCPQVVNDVIVTFDEVDLAKSNFDEKLAETIDGLKSAGAQEAEIYAHPPSEQGRVAPVLFTVKDPGPALLEATRRAQSQAEALGQEVARNSKLKIRGILDARVNRPLEVQLPHQQDINILDELNVRYYSASKDGVTIPATFAVEFRVK